MKTEQYVSPGRTRPLAATTIVDIFRSHELQISSESFELSTPLVFAKLSEDLKRRGLECAFVSESGIKKSLEFPSDSLQSGTVLKFDAFEASSGTALVTLAGQALVNTTYLKSVIHASLAPKIKHLVLAVRVKYRTSADFEKIKDFLDVLMNSRSTQLDVDSLTLIGY